MVEYMSREDYCEETCGIENREGYKTCHNCGMLNVPSVDVQPMKLIQRIVQGRLNGANYTLLEAVKSNDTNTAYKMRGAIDMCNEILADLRILTAKDGEQNG